MRLCILCLAIAVSFFSYSQAQIELDNITISKNNDSIYVEIITSESVQYEHFLIKTAPEKIVVDLKGTVNNWSKQKFLSLPLKSIARIRTSQFQVTPELVARVVLDVNRPVNYTVEQLPAGLRISIPAVESEQVFTPWNAKQQLIKVVTLERKSIKKPAKAEMKITSKAKQTKIRPKRKSGIKLESFPKRKLIKYKAGNVRDPFMPLVGTRKASMVPGEVPEIENQSIVGIFHDESGRQALLEDTNGNGFILKPNDRIQNGYLVSIQQRKAIFQISEYGWTRTVALKLQLPELK